MKKRNIFLALTTLLISLSGCENTTPKKETYLHSFSVSETSSIYFAPGNLEYNPAKATWRFAENSYVTQGESNENIGPDYDGWIDLFGWGANGISGIMPYEFSEDNTAYAPGHKDIAGTSYDFSTPINQIMNENYRMFTHEEIHYLLMYRENAEKLFGYGTIDEHKGLFLLPDDFNCPKDISFSPSVEHGFTNQYNWYYTIGDNTNYTYNNFTSAQWDEIEKAGGVFLPTGGMRCGRECSHLGISGHYWTSSFYGEEFANCLCLFEEDLFLEGNFDRCYGLSVRLVKEASNK